MGGVLIVPAYSRVALSYRELRRCPVEGSLLVPCPPVLTGAPVGLKPLEIAARRGVLLLPSSPGSLADVSGNDYFRDETIYNCLPASLREQGQEIARTLPLRQRAREHEPFLRARHPHVQQAPPLGLETRLQFLRHVHPAQRAVVAQPQAQGSRRPILLDLDRLVGRLGAGLQSDQDDDRELQPFGLVDAHDPHRLPGRLLRQSALGLVRRVSETRLQ